MKWNSSSKWTCRRMDHGRANSELVEDIAAMAAGSGGYIVIGLQEHKTSSVHALEPVGFPAKYHQHFDVSNVRQLVERYVSVRIDLTIALLASGMYTAGERFGLICVMPASEFPVLMRGDGAYAAENKRQCFAFRDGDILVRRGGSTVRATQADVRQIVSRIRAVERTRWVEELAEVGLDELIDAVSEMRRIAKTKGTVRQTKRELPSTKLILGPESGFEERFLNMLSESGDE